MAHVKDAGTFLLAEDLMVHRLGFGAMRLTGPGIWGNPKNRSEAIAVLKQTINLGINFIDTADSYGPEISENLIAEALHPYPKGLIIATKGGLVRPSPEKWVPVGRSEYLMQCVEMSLRRLKVDCIDLYQFHAIDPKVSLEESLSALKHMQVQGKIRHIGLSNVSVNEIERAKKIAPIVSIQNHYNLSNQDSDPVVDYCDAHRMAFIPWYPLGNGHLANPQGEINKLAKEKNATSSQIALAWLLKRSPSIIPIPGTSSLAHLEENAAASSIQLSDQEFKRLSTKI